IVALICRLACLRPAVRHALWLIVLIKLMTPPLVHWPWPAPDVWRQVQAETSPTAAKPSGADLPTWQLSERPTSVEVSRADEPPIEQEMSPEDLIREESGEPIFAVDQPPHPVGQPLQPQVAASPDERIEPLLPAAPGRLELLAVMGFWCWLAGAGVMAIVQLIRILRFRRLLAHRMPAPRWLRLQVEELAHRLGVRPPNVLVLPGIGSPMLWSVGRPTLLWPKALLEQLPPGSRRAVLVHELAHLRRRDHWVGWLELVAACVWWWNPLFWHVRRQLH